MKFDEGIYCWFTNKKTELAFDETNSQWESLLKPLSPDQKQSILRYIFLDDQKRALLSILLQRTAIKEYYKSSSGFTISRTQEVIDCTIYYHYMCVMAYLCDQNIG